MGMVSFKWGHRRNRILYNMNQYNKQGQRHGLWELYHSNGNIEEIEYYIR